MYDPAPATPPAPVERWRWGVVWLLFLATLINYMDRQALYSTSDALLAEFVPANPGDDPEAIGKLRNELYARVNFAFGMSFALFQVVAGFLIDRYSLRWLYVGAIVVWSAAGVLTGFLPAGAVAALMACRVLLGIGEAFNWPCAVACIRRVIPRESRGLANGIFHSGASLGAVATPLVAAALLGPDGAGWRNVFVVVGAVGALWAFLWVAVTAGDRAAVIDGEPAPDPGADPGPAPSLLAVFGWRAFWVCLATGVCVNLCWHFYNQWFPRYLSQEVLPDAAGYVPRDRQWVLAGFYVAADLGSVLSGWLTRKLIRGGTSVERSRKLVMTGLALTVAAATVPAVLAANDAPWVKFPLFYLVAAGAVGGFAIFFSLAQDIVPRRTAQILGVCGCTSWVVISLVGLAAGQVAKPGNYAGLFVAVGCVPLLAAAAGWFWRERATGRG